MERLPADFDRFVDLQAMQDSGSLLLDPAVITDPPVAVAGWKWLYARVAFTTASGAPTTLTIDPTCNPRIDHGVNDWGALPYEPAVAGAGLTTIYPYRTEIAISGSTFADLPPDANAQWFRYPVFGAWMRLSLSIDAGTANAGVLFMRGR